MQVLYNAAMGNAIAEVALADAGPGIEVPSHHLREGGDWVMRVKCGDLSPRGSRCGATVAAVVPTSQGLLFWGRQVDQSRFSVHDALIPRPAEPVTVLLARAWRPVTAAVELEGFCHHHGIKRVDRGSLERGLQSKRRELLV